MAWIRPILSDIRAELYAQWQSYRPDADDGKYSDLWIYAQTMGRIVHSIYGGIEAFRRALMPWSSTGTYLNKWLHLFGQSNGAGGYGLILPHTSSATDALTVTCTSGTPTITDETLVDDAGNRYKIDETYSFAATGTYDADVVSIDTGTAVNLESGDTLTFESPPAGISETATLVKDLDGGLDQETDAEGQSRLLRALQSPSLSGNADHWVQAIEATAQGAYDAYVWSKRANQPYGYGTTDWVALQRGESGLDRITTSTQQTALDAQVEDTMPVRQMEQSRRLTVTADYHIVKAAYKLAPDASSEKQVDWDGYSNQKTVSSTTIADSLIVASSAYSAGLISSGDKVIIANQEATVDLEPGNASAPVSGSYDRFTVSSWVWDTDLSLSSDGPTASGGSFAICAGGGIAADMLDAIVDYLDTIGPERSSYADASSVSPWDDTMRIPWIKNAVIDAADGDVLEVSTCEIDGATSDVSPTETSGTSCNLVVACPYAGVESGEVQIYEDQS
jgi:hypothetical protein